FAMSGLAAGRVNLAAAAYVGELPAGKKNDSAFLEAEWKRVGKVLHEDLGPLRPADLDNVRPAGGRALGEAALLPIRGFYEARLGYGRATTPEYGLFYIGPAPAPPGLGAFFRKVSGVSSPRGPPPRALGGRRHRL